MSLTCTGARSEDHRPRNGHTDVEHHNGERCSPGALYRISAAANRLQDHELGPVAGLWEIYSGGSSPHPGCESRQIIYLPLSSSALDHLLPKPQSLHPVLDEAYELESYHRALGYYEDGILGGVIALSDILRGRRQTVAAQPEAAPLLEVTYCRERLCSRSCSFYLKGFTVFLKPASAGECCMHQF